jgi:hypothetical protein
MWVVSLFALFGVFLGIGFFINGVGMDPASAIQQQVRYLSYVISATGWIIFALAVVMGLLNQILQALKQLATTFTAPAAPPPTQSP